MMQVNNLPTVLNSFHQKYGSKGLYFCYNKIVNLHKWSNITTKNHPVDEWFFVVSLLANSTIQERVLHRFYRGRMSRFLNVIVM